MNIKKTMKREYGAVPAVGGLFFDKDNTAFIEVYENERTQQRWLVEVIDGAARVYSYCGEVGK